MYKVPQKKCRLRDDEPKRFSPDKYREYQNHILSFGVCQVCDESTDLDTPHHTKQGLGVKDDRSLICICISCHDILHRVGFETLKKTRLELEEIGRINWVDYDS